MNAWHNFKGEIRSLLDPDLSKIAAKSLLVRLLMVFAIIWSLPIILIAVIATICDMILDNDKIEPLFNSPMRKLVTWHDQLYNDAVNIIRARNDKHDELYTDALKLARNKDDKNT